MKRYFAIGATALLALTLTACHQTTSTATDKAKSFTSTKVVQSSSHKHQVSSSTSSKNSRCSQATHSETQTTQAARRTTDTKGTVANHPVSLQGKSYIISPKLYDGELVNQAMSKPGTPQNLVHDNFVTLYFKGLHTVQEVLGIDRHQRFTQRYTLHNGILTVELPSNHSHKIPYTINNGNIQFSDWTERYDDPHTLTWEIKADPSEDAKNFQSRTF